MSVKTKFRVGDIVKRTDEEGKKTFQGYLFRVMEIRVFGVAHYTLQVAYIPPYEQNPNSIKMRYNTVFENFYTKVPCS